MAISNADFLFPRDLEVSETRIKNVLVVGSCAAGVWALKISAPNVNFDYLVMNNVEILPDKPPKPIEEYDFQFVQISLRHVVTDRIVRFYNYLAEEYRSKIVNDAMQNLEIFLESCLKYNVQHGIIAFVSNFPVPQRSSSAALESVGAPLDFSHLVAKLNERLAVLISKYRNVYISDYDSIGNSMGKRYFNNDLMDFYTHNTFWHPGQRNFDVAPEYNAPMPGRIEPLPEIDSLYPSQLKEMLDTLWRQWETMYRIVRQIDTVKLVIFDLDDTLWRGQIAEHYGDDGGWPVFDGWPTGLWEAVHHLRARGIMVGICSKNEESLVRARWDRAIMNDWLSLDDFLFKEINWNTKAENISKIIKQANLTPTSVLFVDDNPVERESVRMALPGIRVIGDNPYVVRRLLLWSAETQVATLSKESARRENMIHSQIKREADRSALSREDFLKQLNCVVRIYALHNSTSNDFPRCVELLNKTNQFNTTGRRWNAAEVVAFLSSGGIIYYFNVEDRYVNYGLVGVILFKDGLFEQFAMSCRVLGLAIETSVIGAIVKSEGANVPTFSAKITETKENIMCRDVYLKSGFQHAEDPTRFYLSSIDAKHASTAAHVAISFASE